MLHFLRSTQAPEQTEQLFGVRVPEGIYYVRDGVVRHRQLGNPRVSEGWWLRGGPLVPRIGCPPRYSRPEFLGKELSRKWRGRQRRSGKKKAPSISISRKGRFFPFLLLSYCTLRPLFQADGKRGGISKEKQNIHQSSHLATKYGNYDNDKKTTRHR